MGKKVIIIINSIQLKYDLIQTLTANQFRLLLSYHLDHYKQDHRTLVELGPSGDFKIPYSSSRANLPELKRMDTSISGDDVVAKKSLCRMRPDQSEVMLESVLKGKRNRSLA